MTASTLWPYGHMAIWPYGHVHNHIQIFVLKFCACRKRKDKEEEKVPGTQSQHLLSFPELVVLILCYSLQTYLNKLKKGQPLDCKSSPAYSSTTRLPSRKSLGPVKRPTQYLFNPYGQLSEKLLAIFVGEFFQTG